MKRGDAWVALLALLLPCHVYGLQKTPPSVSGLRSPEVTRDHRVTFRLFAPKAGEVILNGDWPGGRNVAMSENDKGIWSATVGPLDPELWSYAFSVDGVRTIDCANPQALRDGVCYRSLLLIPGPESALYEETDAPHGTISMVRYVLSKLGQARRLCIYTPPGYEKGRGRYPVLYLLHGEEGDETLWSALGRANLILDNLIARGKAEPMSVVMPDGGTDLDPGLISKNLVQDIVPFVEKRYRVLRKPNQRAIAGLSVGGGQTMAATAQYPGTFGYIGVWSPESWQPDDKAARQLSAIKAAGVRLVYAGCGMEDATSDAASTKLVELLRKLDMRYRFKESTGAHTWFNWRIYLSEFAPLLFR
jgi:enterochelin esterase family protein